MVLAAQKMEGFIVMKTLGIIPARYGSTRFEGKPLADICGSPMIEWVYKSAEKAGFDELVVATDDSRIYDCVIGFGGKCEMTGNHETGSDRIAEVAMRHPEYDIIINIQGDEPLIEAEVLKKLAGAFNDKSVVMATMKHLIENVEDIDNPNVVKVITDMNNDAIYFSRSKIPYERNKSNVGFFRHIGIYGYKREFLLNYNKLKNSEIEKSESLEQLRAIENGYKIRVLETKQSAKGVDTLQDLEEICRFIIEKNIKIKGVD